MADIDHVENDEISSAVEASGLSEELGADLVNRMKHLAGYRPTIALLGKTGGGKSSLGNALFGREVFAVSSVRAGTRAPNPLSAVILGVDMTLVDFPGVGESRDRDEEYRALYNEWIGRIDVALWVVKMDDRVLAPDLDYFEQVIRPSKFPIERVVFVVSQIDKADPVREWDEKTGNPSPKQLGNIDDKIAQLREAFGVAPSQVVPVSAEGNYNLHALAERIVSACPNEAALNVARALQDDLKTEQVKKAVIGKVLESMKRFYKENRNDIHAIITVIVTAIMKARRK